MGRFYTKHAARIHTQFLLAKFGGASVDEPSKPGRPHRRQIDILLYDGTRLTIGLTSDEQLQTIIAGTTRRIGLSRYWVIRTSTPPAITYGKFWSTSRLAWNGIDHHLRFH